MLRKLIILPAGIVLAVIVLTVVWFGWLWSPSVKTEVGLTVKTGESSLTIAKKLASLGAVKPAWLFNQYLKRTGLATKLKAGEYVLPAGLSPKGVAKLLITSPGRDEKTILIKEGMSNREIAAYLKAQNLITDDSFSGLASRPIADLPSDWPKFDFLTGLPKSATVEGYLFPDTYRLFAEDKGDALIRKMLDNFNDKLSPEMRQAIVAQNKTILQIVTMASLLEKEVRSTDDMKIVSGIFWQRMANGQRLESCASLAYILGVNKPQYTIEDTLIDSPYNTYRHDGLPPGPIGNPGLKAIEAAIFPEVTQYNFFLSDPTTGKTIWAKTFEEHKANKAKYLD